MDRDGTFSEFELDQFGIKVAGEEQFTRADAVGSCEETLNTKVVTKKSRGVVVKKRVRPDGTGSLKLSMHMPYEIFASIYGLQTEGLIDGVKAYGTSGRHPTMAITVRILDEDDVIKYKAYPNCILESGISRKVENGGEEVAEIELEVSLMPDEYGNCMYEALATELPEDGELTLNTWMTNWSSEAMHTVKIV